LNKRERWALENAAEPTAELSADDNESAYTPETLRQTLAELPDAHRECLVLFYVEGKSGADTAAALGISESALRVRLHRARGAMRERLEEKLEGSLGKLRPANTLAPGVMAAVLGSSSAKAATAGGVGTAIGGVFTKIGLSKWLVPFASFFSFFIFLPMFLISWLFSQMELKNFRDEGGFRARLFRKSIKHRLLFLAGLVFVVAVLSPAVSSHFSGHLPVVSIEARQSWFFLLLGAIGFIFLPFSLRLTVINRNRYFLTSLLGSIVTSVSCLLVGFSVIPTSIIGTVVFAVILVTLPFYGLRPVRMDYNLFLRASEGLFNLASEVSPTKSRPQSSKLALLEFARFLGRRWLVNDYRWTNDGLRLRLPPTAAAQWSMWFEWTYNRSWKRRSFILLRWDGTVGAELCKADEKALLKLLGKDASKIELERQVGDAVGTAWSFFRDGKSAGTEGALGELAEGEIFVVSPRTGGTAKMRWAIAILLVLLLLTQCGTEISAVREWFTR
jgi:hypothetical protein